MASSILSARPLAAHSLNQVCGNCPQCRFDSAYERPGEAGLDDHPAGDAAAGSGARLSKERGRFKSTHRIDKGDWKKAIIYRPGASPMASRIRERNVNDFLKYSPVGVLRKGTRLLHVSPDSSCGPEGMAGSGKEDGYSFFALQKKGDAPAHGDAASAQVQMHLTRDVHIFFIHQYTDITRWYGDRQRNGKYRIDKRWMSVGANLANAITEDAWPTQYRPLGWAGCSECELVFHNSIIPNIMLTVGAKVPGAGAPPSRIGKPMPLPPPPTKDVMCIRPPWWMSPYFHDERKIREAEARYLTPKKEVDPSFFEIDPSVPTRPANPAGSEVQLS